MAAKNYEKEKKLSCRLQHSTIVPSPAKIPMPETIEDFTTLPRGKCGATIYTSDRNARI